MSGIFSAITGGAVAKVHVSAHLGTFLGRFVRRVCKTPNPRRMVVQAWKRAQGKGVEGNLKGEGTILGGIVHSRIQLLQWYLPASFF